MHPWSEMEEIIESAQNLHKMYNLECHNVFKIRKAWNWCLKELIKQRQATEPEIKSLVQQREETCFLFTRMFSDAVIPTWILSNDCINGDTATTDGRNKNEVQPAITPRWIEKPAMAPASSRREQNPARGSRGNKRKAQGINENGTSKKHRPNDGKRTSSSYDADSTQTFNASSNSQSNGLSESQSNSGPCGIQRLILSNTFENTTSPEAIQEENIYSSTVVDASERPLTPVHNANEEIHEEVDTESEFADDMRQELSASIRSLPSALQIRLAAALERGDDRLQKWAPKGNDSEVNELCRNSKNALRDSFIKVVTEKRHVTVSNIGSIIVHIAVQTFPACEAALMARIIAFLQRSLLKTVLNWVAEVHEQEGCNAGCPSNEES